MGQSKKNQMFERVPDLVWERLSDSKIGIAGLGGLGSNIACMLARTGCPTLVLVDFDQVEMSNLNRQQYDWSQVGKNKTEALKENLLRMNPEISVEIKNVKITQENAPELFRECQIVCEALDAAKAKSDLINGLLCSSLKIPVVAASGMAGYGNSNEITTKKKMSRLYVCGDEKSDYEQVEGMMAPRVTLCAAHQANLVLRLLMKEKEI